MKWKQYLAISFALAGAMFHSGCMGQGADNSAADATSVVKNIPKIAHLKVVIDTVHVTDANFEKLRTGAAAGSFFWATNKVKVSYFVDETSNGRGTKWCDINNGMLPLTTRHELEHARKAHLTHNTNQYSPFVRAKVAVMNEIMAPAAEIIEYSDRRYVYGKACCAHKLVVAADSAITAHNDLFFNKNKPVDFSNPFVADIVLKYATDKFIASFNRGIYRATIRRKLQGLNCSPYNISDECELFYLGCFMPQQDMWGPMFTFRTQGKLFPVDIWNSATPSARERVLQRVDSVVKSQSVPGQLLIYCAKPKIH